MERLDVERPLESGRIEGGANGKLRWGGLPPKSKGTRRRAKASIRRVSFAVEGLRAKAEGLDVQAPGPPLEVERFRGKWKGPGMCERARGKRCVWLSNNVWGECSGPRGKSFRLKIQKCL